MRDFSDTGNAFNWVDEYLSHVRPHFEVRSADALLIVMPNRAVKLNASGLAILQHLKEGRSIRTILARIGTDQVKREELFHFLCDFRSLMTGCLGEGHNRKAVEVVPQRKEFSALPVLSEIAVTYRCNLRCRFCYAACGCRRDTGTAEMSRKQVARLLRTIREEAGVPSVSFTGGEPLVRSDLELLVTDAVRAGLRVNLITNGCLLAGTGRAERLRSAGLTSAQVSLEGPTARIHDPLTGVPGSFEQSLQGLKALQACGIHVHTNTTVNAENAGHLQEMVRLVAGLGLSRMSMNLIIPAGSAMDLELQVAYSRLWPLLEPAREEARRAGVELMWYSPTPLCIMNPLALGFGNKSCAACDGLLSISPCGDVLPCSSYPEPVGNLLCEPFETVWSSAAALYFRSKAYAPAACTGCEDFAACAGACPLYWSAMGTGELNDALGAANREGGIRAHA